MTYSYTDPDGDRIEVVPSSTSGVDLIATDASDGACTCVAVSPDALPDLVAAMYRAAGQTVPVMITPTEVAEDWVHVTGTRGAA